MVLQLLGRIGEKAFGCNIKYNYRVKETISNQGTNAPAYSHSVSLSITLMYGRMHMPTLSYTVTHTYAHFLSHTHSHSLTHTQSFTHTHSLNHTHLLLTYTYSLSHTQSVSQFDSLTHTHTLLCLSVSLLPPQQRTTLE